MTAAGIGGSDFTRPLQTACRVVAQYPQVCRQPGDGLGILVQVLLQQAELPPAALTSLLEAWCTGLTLETAAPLAGQGAALLSLGPPAATADPAQDCLAKAGQRLLAAELQDALFWLLVADQLQPASPAIIDRLTETLWLLADEDEFHPYRQRRDYLGLLLDRLHTLPEHVLPADFPLPRILQRRGRREEALATLLPNSEVTILRRAALLQELGESERALAELLPLADRQHPEAMLAIGLWYKDRDQLDQAVAWLQRAVEAAPDLAEAGLALGAVRRDQGDPTALLAACGAILERQPEHVDALFIYGNTLRDLGRHDAAMAWYGARLQQYPASGEAMNGLLETLCNRLDFPAVLALAPALRDHPDIRPAARFSLLIKEATVAFCLADNVRSRQCLQQADTLVPSHRLWSMAEKRLHKRYIAYRNLLHHLLYYDQQATMLRQTHATQPKCHFVGDSHVLPSSWAPIQLSGQTYQVVPNLIMGCKAWHLAAATPNQFQQALATAVAQLGVVEQVVFSAGEIDCRFDEGILSHCRKRGLSLPEVIARTARRYVERVAAAFADTAGQLWFMNVAAPQTQHSFYFAAADDALRCALIRDFNAALESAVLAAGHGIIDVYSLTANPAGRSNGQYHFDEYHLLPRTPCLAPQRR